MYKTILNSGRGYYEDKKSKFYGEIYPVDREEEIEQRIAAVKKRYPDARHHCYAYILGKKNSKKKYDDNGEPSMTAGPPILKVLEASELTNILCIVTRYFGGTLLGKGGLVKAYSTAAQEALANAKIVSMEKFVTFQIQYNYTEHGISENYLLNHGYPMLDILFTDKISFTTYVYEYQKNHFTEALKELTGGRIKIEEGEVLYLPVYKECILIGEEVYRQERFDEC